MLIYLQTYHGYDDIELFEMLFQNGLQDFSIIPNFSSDDNFAEEIYFLTAKRF